MRFPEAGRMEKRARITTRDGRITDEGRRRIERELDLEEASIAGKKDGGSEPATSALHDLAPRRVGERGAEQAVGESAGTT